MSVKNYFLQVPYLCKTPNAARWSRSIELQWDDELSNKDSVFARNEDDINNPANRLETAFGFFGESDIKGYCYNLGKLILFSYNKNKYGEDNTVEIEKLWADLASRELLYPEVSAVMSVETALATDAWDG